MTLQDPNMTVFVLTVGLAGAETIVASVTKSVPMIVLVGTTLIVGVGLMMLV